MATSEPFYRLTRRYEDDLAAFNASPALPEGKRLKVYDPNVTNGVLRFTDSRRVPDAWLEAGVLMLNEQLRDHVLASLRISPTVRWVPIALERSGRNVGELWAPLTEEEHSVLDRARAEFTCYPGKTVIATVEKWVLDPASYPGYDLFRGDLGEWFASSAFKTHFEASGCIGLVFLECETA
jgi:hypothetical protein